MVRCAAGRDCLCLYATNRCNIGFIFTACQVANKGQEQMKNKAYPLTKYAVEQQQEQK